MSILNRFMLTIIIIVMTSLSAWAQLKLSITSVDNSKYPHISATVKVSKNSLPVEVKKEECLIIEERMKTYPESISKISDGTYQINWIVCREFYDDNNSFLLSIVVGNDMGYTSANIGKVSFKTINTYKGSSLQETQKMNFSKSGDIQQVYLRSEAFVDTNGRETGPMLDSIQIIGKYFSIRWQGNNVYTGNPPLKIMPAFLYLLDVKFTPPDNKAYSGVLVLHYEGGQKKYIQLMGGEFSVIQSSLLQVVYPNGGESFTPCQDITIKWKGYAKDMPVIVQYSPDNGVTWQNIGSSRDSTLKWTVPSVNSDKVLIKAFQEPANEAPIPLSGKSGRVSTLDFSPSGSFALSGFSDASIVEWDLYASGGPKIVNNYDISSGSGQLLNCNYLTSDSSIVAYYFSGGAFRIDLFNKGVSDPVKTVALPAGFYANRMIVDPFRKFLAFVSSFDSKILFISSNDLSVIGYYYFDMPVMSVSFAKDKKQVFVAKANGIIDNIDCSDLSVKKIIKSIDKSYYPLIIQSGVSPNADLFAFTNLQTRALNFETQVLDVNQEEVVKVFSPAATTPLEVAFSPSSSSIVISSPGQEQIALYDLTNSKAMTMRGHTDLMTAAKLDPDGHTLLTGSDDEENLKLRRFSYPETDMSNNTFTIESPIIDLKQPTVTPVLIGTESKYKLTANVCNTGKQPAYIYNEFLATGSYYKLESLIIPDTIVPGACKTVEFVYSPLDTGLLKDEVVFTACLTEYRLPLAIHSKDRTLTFIEKIPAQFGEACINEIVTKEFDFFRNDDNIPVRINAIAVEKPTESGFSMISKIRDTIIPPGGILRIKVAFTPKKLGATNDRLIIYYCDQNNVKKYADIAGMGIGSTLEINIPYLTFIPEISKRKVKIKNNGNKFLNINEINFTPAGAYSVASSFPIVLTPNAETELEISCLANPIVDAEVSFVAEPCLTSGSFKVGPYVATSKVYIQTITADPRKETVIPVNFSTIENVAYQGERFFESEFTVKQGLFFPTEVTSSFGTAKLVSNEVKNDLRYVKFRVDGDFNKKSGVVAEIKGVAGLSDVFSSPITITDNQLNWGKAVQVSRLNGELRIIDIAEGRKLIKSLSNMMLSPNPAANSLNIEFNMDFETNYKIEIYDYLGRLVMATSDLRAYAGTNNYTLNVSALPEGRYNLVLLTGEGALSYVLVIGGK